MRPVQVQQLQVRHDQRHHDARAHQRGRAAPWFALAIVAFVTALKVH
jgi:hypothetical protein